MRVAAILAAVVVSGCVSTQQRIADARASCLAAGYQSGTQALADCTITGARRAQADAAERSRRFGEAMTRLSEQMRQQQQANTPHFTSCQQYGNRIECVSN